MRDPDPLASIDRITETPPSDSDAKKAGKVEAQALKEELADEEKREEIRSLRQDIDERKKYAEKSFTLVAYWIGGVFAMLLLQGFFNKRTYLATDDYNMDFAFTLSDQVLLAVVGGTTVSIIGIFLVVANYLFPKR